MARRELGIANYDGPNSRRNHTTELRHLFTGSAAEQSRVEPERPQ